jgi:hypothetical protein
VQELARVTGFDAKTLRRHLAAGAPGRGANGAYSSSRWFSWLLAHYREASGDPEQQLRAAKVAEVELALAERRGELVPAEAVRTALLLVRNVLQQAALRARLRLGEEAEGLLVEAVEEVNRTAAEKLPEVVGRCGSDRA